MRSLLAKICALLTASLMTAGCSDVPPGGAGAGGDRDAAMPDARRTDLCGNGVDDDGLGGIDDGCPCAPGETQSCHAGPLATRGVGACRDGVQTCAVAPGIEWGSWGDYPCEGSVTPAEETCEGLDLDCDAAVDEGCPCAAGATRDCGGDIPRPAPCRAGTQRCGSEGAWSACEGAVEPSAEICDNGVDDNCDGEVDPEHLCACIPVPEVCGNGVDDDCDGESDDGCCASATESCGDGADDDCDDRVDEGCSGLGAPALRFPHNGYQTGSVHAATETSGGPMDQPLRPMLMWEPVPAATEYELALDDSCSFPGFRACAFPSPERVVRTPGIAASRGSALEHRLAAPLPVAMTAPVGRRYAWRVRACDGTGCGAWSEVRYLDVGRTPGDLDGDGYADLAAPQARFDLVYLFRGGPAGLEATPSVTLDVTGDERSSVLQYAVSTDGDLDGDGRCDLVVGASWTEVAGVYNAGAVLVSNDVLRGATPTITRLSGEPPVTRGNFGESVAVGDVDADGFADVVVGSEETTAQPVRLYRGSPTGVEITPSALLLDPGSVTPSRTNGFGDSVDASADLDGDGAVDLLVGARFASDARPSQGSIHAFRWGGGSFSLLRTIRCPGDQDHAFFGVRVVASADLDGDGWGDALTSALRYSSPETSEGGAFVFASPLTAGPTRALDNPRDLSEAGFGVSLEVGDLDGDGQPELVVGAEMSAAASEDATECSILGMSRRGSCYFGSLHVFDASGATVATLSNPAPTRSFAGSGKYFGWQTTVRDVDGDGFDDVVAADPWRGIREVSISPPRAEHNEGSVYVFLGSRTGVATAHSTELRSPLGASSIDFGGGVE